jgi:hypothetical protein
MMSAGASARQEAQRSLLHATAYEELARASREQAERYELAARTEASVGHRLRTLEALGWTILSDRRWAGSRRANVDFLLVGAGGVVIVDVKAWRSLEVRNGSVFCEDDCRDDEVAKVLGLTDQVHDCLSALGLTRRALHPALVFAGRSGLHQTGQQVSGLALVGEMDVAAWVTRLGTRLDEHQVSEIVALLDEGFPPYDVKGPTARVARLRLPMPIRKAAQPETLFDVDDLTDALVERALAEPIESWMTFLHPEQLKLVGANHSGPARVRGPAGTGKTVVGLHRAAHLAERSDKMVLFVSFVKTLPIVLGNLCERMSPSARANIHFTGLHRLALDTLEAAGVQSRIDAAKVQQAFAAAWSGTGRHSRLTQIDERPSYWKEEIDYVIKGRGLTDFDDYSVLRRIGRSCRLGFQDREAVWDLYVEYERLLDRAGIHDFTDVLLMAGDLVRSGDVQTGYGPVIVDEVQDLNLAGIQLLHAIGGDGPNGLYLIGDGQQSVYPGGFTLSEAGIAVTGRATVLRTNYRNTVEIIEAATRIVAADQFDDLEGEPAPGTREVTVVRHGYEPIIVWPDNRHSLEVALTSQILGTIRLLGVPPGDMAVLVRTRAELDRYSRVLSRAGIPYVDLQDYDGNTSDRVKVGTFKRAKGLEFKFVLIPGLRADSVPPQWPGESEDSHRERAERERRELYVGMTRARDGLWLGYLPD